MNDALAHDVAVMMEPGADIDEIFVRKSELVHSQQEDFVNLTRVGLRTPCE